MIKIFKLNDGYRDSIITLWQSCFGDSEEYISFFLDNCPDFVTVGYFVEERLVSMLFLLEGSLIDKKCKYLYAACTHTEFRRQGIMESLIESAKSYCADNGYSGIFLVPANESLYAYYSKFGFVSSFVKKKLTFKTYNSEYIENCDCNDIQVICDLKEKLLSEINGFRFDRSVLEYTVKEHLFNNGKISIYTGEEGSSLAFYFVDNNDVIVKEFLTDFNISTVFVQKLFSNKNAENIYILTPIVYNNKDIEEKYTKCGMCLPLDSEIKAFLDKNTCLYAGMYLD